MLPPYMGMDARGTPKGPKPQKNRAKKAKKISKKVLQSGSGYYKIICVVRLGKVCPQHKKRDEAGGCREPPGNFRRPNTLTG